MRRRIRMVFPRIAVKMYAVFAGGRRRARLLACFTSKKAALKYRRSVLDQGWETRACVVVYAYASDV